MSKSCQTHQRSSVAIDIVTRCSDVLLLESSGGTKLFAGPLRSIDPTGSLICKWANQGQRSGRSQRGNSGQVCDGWAA